MAEVLQPRIELRFGPGSAMKHEGNTALAELRSDTVLVVESDDRQRAGLGRVLRAGGHEVLEAPNAMSAVALMNSRRPAIVVVGDGPLGRTSAQMLRAIGRLAAPCEPPTVVVTGYSPTVDAPGVALGIQKPFRVEDLLSAVERFKHARRPDC